MPPPPAVSGFTVTSVNYRQIALAWDLYVPVTLINNFHLYVGLDAADRTNMISISRNTATTVITFYPFGNTNPWLVPGTLYYLTILGHSSVNGPGPETQLTATTTVLAAPTGLISSGVSDTTVNTNWTSYPVNTRISNLNYLIDIIDPPVSGTLIDRALTSRNQTGLTPNTQYYINLTAIINQGSGFPVYESPPAVLGIVTNASPPIGPVAFQTPTPTTITMSWTNPAAPPTNILLAISTTPVFTNTVTLDPGTAEYQWTGLTPSTTYFFRVQNINQVGVLTASITGSIATIAIPPVVSVLFTNITSSGFRANFVFDAINPPEVIGYRIAANEPPVGPYTYTPNFVTFLEFVGDEDLYYFIDVVARIDEFDSTVVAAAVYTSNATPTNFTPSAAPTEFTITMGWDPSFSPTTGYNIWISLVDNVWGDPITLEIVNTYEFTGLTHSTTYYFKLIDLGSIGPSEPAYSIAITATTPPPAPEGLIADIIGSTDIGLAWYAVPEAISYNIQRSADDDPNFYLPPVPLGAGTTSYHYYYLVPDTFYNFRLTYFIAGGVESEPAIFGTSTLPNLNTPSNYILYVYKVTHGFKNSPNSPQRSIGRPVFRQIRGGR